MLMFGVDFGRMLYISSVSNATLQSSDMLHSYVAEIKDLNGCLTQGETIEESVTNINEARELWLETAYEYGDEIPLPSSEYSGKLMLRMPKGLHHRLAILAKSEGVSLNQYLLFLLSSATGNLQ